jgi:tRNA pseudouridine65 synthase
MLGPHLAPPYPVLYQDTDFVVLNKPPGIGLQPAISEENVPGLLEGAEAQLNRRIYPWHSLDRGCSGAYLFSFFKAPKEDIQAWQQSRGTRSYLALVRGWVLEDGRIESHDESSNRTRFRPLERFELPFPISRYQTCRFSLIQLEPQGDSKNQLRKHLRKINHPIIGDKHYGDNQQNQFFRSWAHQNRLMLYCINLLIPGASSRAVEAGLSPGDQRVLDKLRNYPSD